MTKSLLGAALIATLSFGAQAQTNDTLMKRPGQVSFIYPLGTSGVDSPKYSNNFSFNVLYGINGGLQGLEFGGLVNMNVGDVTGAQFAGITNINTKKTNGIMAAGIANIVKDTSNALCFAGIANVHGESAIGLHFGGIANTVNGRFLGGQFAGISNTVNGDMIGAQFGGISNIVNGNYIGLQAAGISNIANGNVIGGQLGLINSARKVTGFQLGLINIAEDFEKGAPLGLISFVKNGFHAIEISGGEAIYGNASLKIGVNGLYNIFKVGYAANGSDNYFTYGLGLGSMVGLGEKAKISFDLTGNHIVDPSFSPKINVLSRADVAFRYHFGEHIALFGGPSFNVYVSEYNIEAENAPLNVPYAIYEDNWWNGEGSTSLWIGANAGVSIMF